MLVLQLLQIEINQTGSKQSSSQLSKIQEDATPSYVLGSFTSPISILGSTASVGQLLLIPIGFLTRNPTLHRILLQCNRTKKID